MADGPDIAVTPDDEPVAATPDEQGPGAGGHEAPGSGADGHVRRNLLVLSLANWALAVVAWTISAYLGVTSPASIMVYTILFLIGLFAAIVAVGAYVLEKFAHRPGAPAGDAAQTDERDVAATPSA
jgi:hypothetical protein